MKAAPRSPMPIGVVHRLQRGRDRTHERPFHDHRPSGVVAATHVEPVHHQRRSGENPGLTAYTFQLSGGTCAHVYRSDPNVTIGGCHVCRMSEHAKPLDRGSADRDALLVNQPLPDGLLLRTAQPTDLDQISALLTDRGEAADAVDHRLIVEDPDAGWESCAVVVDGNRVV